MWTYLVGPILAFLPSRWRASRLLNLPVNWPHASVLSGLMESLLACAALVVWYSFFVTRHGAAIAAAIPDPYAGLVGLLSFAVHPLTWVVCYHGAEGAVRLLSGLTADEAPGTLLLVAADHAIHFAGTGRWGFTPPRVRDEVTRGVGEWDLRVASCRPKPHWKFPLTIQYENEFFRVVAEQHTPSPAERPHVYGLERLPGNEIIKGLEPFDPNDVLAEQKPPGFFPTVLRELHKRWSR